jgi:hypothetical protein
MKVRMILAVLAVCAVSLTGCKKSAPIEVKVDSTRPIADVETEAASMDVDQLRAIAIKYKAAIEAKQPEIEKIMTKLQNVPPTELLGEDAKKLQDEITAVMESVGTLKKHYQVYYDKLVELKADVTDVKL